MTSTPPIRITRDLRLLVASVLDGAAAPDHLRAVSALMSAAHGRTDSCRQICASGEVGMVDRARNALLGAFLASDATHLLLVEGAIGFAAEAVLDMIDRMQGDPALAVMVAPCTLRQINWALVATAHAAGAGADDPAQLARFGGQFVVDFLQPTDGIGIDQPVELASAEAGLWVIRRDVIEQLCQAHTDLRYATEPQDHEAGPVGATLHALFQSTVDPASGRLLSGPALFCYRARAAGFRLWLAPWIRTTNTGSMRFAGSLADLADLEVPTPA